MRETRFRPVSNRPENVSKLWETIVLIIQSILGPSLKVYFQFFAWNPRLKSRDISKSTKALRNDLVSSDFDLKITHDLVCNLGPI